MNTKITFYWTGIRDHEFEKVIFEAVVPCDVVSDKRDAENWLGAETNYIFNHFDFELVFEHVILRVSKTTSDIQDVKEIDSIPGTLTFRRKAKKISEVDRLKKTIKDSSKRSEKLQIKIDKLKRETAAINDEIEKIKKAAATPVKREYQSCWIDPFGERYDLPFAEHNRFASDWLDENMSEEWVEEHLHSRFSTYAYEILQDLGWIRILGWNDPPCFVIPNKISVIQKSTLKDYCMGQNVDYSAWPEILKS